MNTKQDIDKYHCKRMKFGGGQEYLVPMFPPESNGSADETEAMDAYEEYENYGSYEGFVSVRERLALECKVVRKILGLVYDDLPEQLGLDRMDLKRVLGYFWGADVGNGTGPVAG